jgi:hypothetical protein
VLDRLKVAGHDSLVRDVSNGAIINTDKTEVQRYLQRREEARIQKEKMDQISHNTKEINNIKNELQEIKSLILQILQK